MTRAILGRTRRQVNAIGFLKLQAGGAASGGLRGSWKLAGLVEKLGSGVSSMELVRGVIGQVHLHLSSTRQRLQLPVTPHGSPLVLYLPGDLDIYALKWHAPRGAVGVRTCKQRHPPVPRPAAPREFPGVDSRVGLLA